MILIYSSLIMTVILLLLVLLLLLLLLLLINKCFLLFILFNFIVLDSDVRGLMVFFKFDSPHQTGTIILFLPHFSLFHCVAAIIVIIFACFEWGNKFVQPQKLRKYLVA